jgi:biopolymer transport protein TolR
MPAMASRGRGRRTINEINMVPFIDVMLVLLIIFMVTAPMLTPGAINMPSAGISQKPPANVARVILNKDGSIQLKTREATVTLRSTEVGQAALRWQQAQSKDKEIGVLLSADKDLSYEAVMKTLGVLKKAGVDRVALEVKQGN